MLNSGACGNVEEVGTGEMLVVGDAEAVADGEAVGAVGVNGLGVGLGIVLG